MVEREQIGIRLGPDVLAMIDSLAEEDGRNRSDMVRKLLMEALNARMAGKSPDIERLVDERVRVALAEHVLIQRQVQDTVNATLEEFLRAHGGERPDLSPRPATADYLPVPPDLRIMNMTKEQQ